MIRVNLLPVREQRRRANLRQQALALGAVALAAVAVSGVLWVRTDLALRAERARLESVRAELARAEKRLGEIERFRAQRKEIERKLEVIESLERARQGPVRILDELATRVPERLWLTKLALREGRLELEGYAVDNEVVAEFMRRLEASPVFENVRLSETAMRTEGGFKLAHFKIDCRDRLAARAEAPPAPPKRRTKRR